MIIRQAAIRMREAGKGAVVFISSNTAYRAIPNRAAYGASKGGVIALTKSLGRELGFFSIRVNCVAPGVINTRMNANLSVSDLEGLADETPLGRLGTTNEVASTSLFLASNAAEFITGQVISPNGGFVI